MDAIIIGGGAAGLMAAKLLSGAGLTVCILEARERLGGRIYTFNDPFSNATEGGAEFIHGNLEVTLELLKEAGIEKQELQGETWQVVNGNLTRESEFFRDAETMIERLKEIKEDISIGQFLEKYFSDDKFEGMRRSLTSYVEGYYSGDISKTSAKSFLQEWMSEDEQQYRPVGGYGKMIQYLADRCEKAQTIFQLSTIVKEIRWSKGQVEVTNETGQSYAANKVIVTVPLGVWTADENTKGSIRYSPALPLKMQAAKQLGFGSVTKVLLRFNDNFYQKQLIKKQGGPDLSGLHMALTDEPIPTWWTQFPLRSSLLTGWLSGPAAANIRNEDDEAVLLKALNSLAAIFNVDVNILKENLQWWEVFNWTKDPFTRGSYSYSTLDTAVARKVLMEPVEDTLFFAGEALYEGTEMGTVEAALTSGRDVALKIING